MRWLRKRTLPPPDFGMLSVKCICISGAATSSPNFQMPIADFHAAGRHSHITELLRNGASLPEAKELARHSDIRMTMKYTHIGIHDQAAAIKQLPWKPSEQKNGEPDTATLRVCSGSDSGVVDGYNVSLNVRKEGASRNDTTPVGDEGCRDKSPSDSDCQKWRRRELNEGGICCKTCGSTDLSNSPCQETANWECQLGIPCPCATRNGFSETLLTYWKRLTPAHRRMVDQLIHELAPPLRIVGATQKRPGDDAHPGAAEQRK